MGATIFIPARLDSKRLPGKPLRRIKGKMLIQRCYESVMESGFEPYVVTSDIEIKEAVEDFGGEVVLTSKQPRNGTERVAEAANILGLPDDEIVVNCQGDMFAWHDPYFLIAPIEAVKKEEKVVVTTYTFNYDAYDLRCYHIVKVLQHQDKIDFSRTLRPKWAILGLHYGLYVAKKALFDEYCSWEKEWREVDESLEQLRWKYPIKFIPTSCCPLKVDIESDIKICEMILSDYSLDGDEELLRDD